MVLLQKLFLISLITYLNNASQKDNPVALTVKSDLSVINDKMKDLSSLRSCVSPLPSLMQSVHAEGKNDSYDSTLTEVASCIENSRKTYNELTSLVNSVKEKVENDIPMETDINDVSHISYNTLDFNLDLLDSVYLEKRENDLHFLQTLRTTMKKVRSVDTINMSHQQVFIHFKEDLDLEVSLNTDEKNQYVIQSATLKPTFPCFDEAVSYSIQRNDIELLTSQTIYALYAHKRLVSEVNDLSEKAMIENKDDVHMRAVFKDGTSIRFEVPAIYPNTMGLLTIGEVEGPREKELREAIEKRVFSDITGIVEYAYNVLNNYVVCYYFIRKF